MYAEPLACVTTPVLRTKQGIKTKLIHVQFYDGKIGLVSLKENVCSQIFRSSEHFLPSDLLPPRF